MSEEKSVILSINELENMIKAIKTNNPIHNKRIEKCACGIFNFNGYLVKHRHVGHLKFKTIEYRKPSKRG